MFKLRQKMRRKRAERLHARLSSHLSLNSRQERELDDFVAELSEAMQTAEDNRRTIRSKLADLLTEPEFDTSTAKAVLSDAATGFEKCIAPALSSFAVLYDGLDDFQRSALLSLIKTRCV